MKIWISLAACLFIFAGCSSSNKVVKQPPMPAVSNAEYTIGVGDSLSINVWKSPELSSDVPVRPDGRISVPLIGDVVASGRTAEELTTILVNGFGKYVRNAQVTVIVSNPASGQYLRRVRATGAIARPVSIAHQQGMTVLDVVLEAGGLTEFANGNKAKLYREVSGKVTIYPIYLNDILEDGKLDSNYLLAPSDVITVPERLF